MGSVGFVGVVKVILWMVDNGVKVLNNFWGGVGFDFLIKVVMDYVLE